MSAIHEVRVPDIGDFKDVPVIELLVKPGDAVSKDDSLITLESDKATMEVPAPMAGTVRELKVKVGDKVSQGTLIVLMEATAAPAAGASTPPPAASPAPAAAAPAPGASPAAGPAPRGDVHADVLVLGSGPGGYTAAFRAADLGRQVVLVERHATLGGVCLNVGCIPSKALLHAARVIAEAQEMSHFGLKFAKPEVDLPALRGWKDGVVGRLTKGLAGLAKQRKVTVIQGRGAFASPRLLEVTRADGTRTTVSFDHCIIAAGSSVARIPGFPYDDPRLMDSTGALRLEDIPKRLLVIGGGIIGLEMACVYDALGARVTVVELAAGLIPGADRDLVKPLHKRIEKRYEAVLLGTRVAKLEALPEGLRATFEGEGAPAPQTYDRVLMAVGRRPNGRDIGADKAGVTVNERGFIPVDNRQRTGVPHIFAIGDVCGEPMLAHKASHEGKLAAEVIAGHKAAFDARTIPSVAYTDPEVAWMGLTETQAKERGVEIEKASFPWAASGRALATGRDEGLTKLIFEKGTRRLLGAGMVGPNAGELIAETVLGLEMGADAADLGLTIHPHPTLSETVFFAAEIAEGSITDLYMPKR
ncbi:MAG: dihydrolipoyl dehydrogenase [Betaproteobacteria bacterium]|nr:dihydrolipoyl dehydrogenase [Rhodocyclaceae bacterium]MCA3142335.1 dihydrolipoyl dehydrogenase [Rhodocyclaceae bacterium]